MPVILKKPVLRPVPVIKPVVQQILPVSKTPLPTQKLVTPTAKEKRLAELSKAEVYPDTEIGCFLKWLDERDLVICHWWMTEYRSYRGTKRLIEEYEGKIGPLFSDNWLEEEK